MNNIRIAGYIVGFILAILVLDWIVMGQNFFLYKFWAPKYEDARRETYEHTKSYRQGSVQRLNTLCTQVASAEPNQKTMLNSVIAQEFSEWDMNDVPTYLQPCLVTARR